MDGNIESGENMTTTRGASLFHAVAVRILGERLRESRRAEVTRAASSDVAKGVDLIASGVVPLRVKVKCDPYFGSDAMMIANRDLPFYRGESDTLALEAIADSESRAPGWAVASAADELWYYRLALAAPEDELAALYAEPDLVFFAELPVAADDLVILPMGPVTSWFSANLNAFPSRPVSSEGKSTWQRLVPRATLMQAVSPAEHVGPVFRTLEVR